jgi:ferric-dicitrate binding protein FerR (iron transport regulator)
MASLQAFTRVTQQQPDNAEAWNNIAALWLNLNRPKEAFSALAQCVK